VLIKCTHLCSIIRSLPFPDPQMNPHSEIVDQPMKRTDRRLKFITASVRGRIILSRIQSGLRLSGGRSRSATDPPAHVAIACRAAGLQQQLRSDAASARCYCATLGAFYRLDRRPTLPFVLQNAGQPPPGARSPARTIRRSAVLSCVLCRSRKIAVVGHATRSNAACYYSSEM